jgi:TPR repeat protein
MTVTVGKDVASNILKEKNTSFFTLDFERLSVNDAQGNIESKNKNPEKFTQDSIAYTNSSVALKPDEIILDSSNTNSTVTISSKSSSDNKSLYSTPVLTTKNLQYSPSFQANRTTSVQPNNIPQQSPTSPHFILQQHSPIRQPTQMRNSVYHSNNLNRQPTGYYSERSLPPPPQLQTQIMYKPLPQQAISPQMQHSPMSPQMQHNPMSRPLPPPPPIHMYYPPMRPMMGPPPPMRDANYLTDSSLSAANSAGRRVKQSQFPPFTKENLDLFRENAAHSDKASLDLAKFLVEGATQLTIDDPKKATRAREAMFAEAQKIVKKLANHAGMGKQGYPEAQFFLANCYGTGGMGLSSDPEKAFQLYVQGSKQSHPGCTFRAAVCYEVGAGTKKDKNHAIQFYRKAANLGDETAMYKLGMILLKGLLGQPKNAREGISWLKRAAQNADDDHPHALHELGLCFENDNIPSVIPDPNYARELFTQAAQFGYAPSQFKLGLAYENGFLNCPVDPRRSIAWYSKAAEQGHVEAEFALSGWYLTGAEGVLPQNDREAYLWARKAADRGSAKAEYAVGYYTETGTGVPQDLEEAKRWYMRAAAQHYSRAMQRLTELKHSGGRPQPRRQLTRDGKNTSSNSKDSDCVIM